MASYAFSKTRGCIIQGIYPKKEKEILNHSPAEEHSYLISEHFIFTPSNMYPEQHLLSCGRMQWSNTVFFTTQVSPLKSLIFFVFLQTVFPDKQSQCFTSFISVFRQQAGKAYKDSIGTENQQSDGSHCTHSCLPRQTTRSHTLKLKQHLRAGDNCAVISHKIKIPVKTFNTF